jgi:hypothetical protein
MNVSVAAAILIFEAKRQRGFDFRNKKKNTIQKKNKIMKTNYSP